MEAAVSYIVLWLVAVHCMTCWATHKCYRPWLAQHVVTLGRVAGKAEAPEFLPR